MAKPQTKPPIEKLLYRKSEVAFALGLSVRTVIRMIADQKLSTRRFGRCVLIPAADVRRVAETIIRSDMVPGSAMSSPER